MKVRGGGIRAGRLERAPRAAASAAGLDVAAFCGASRRPRETSTLPRKSGSRSIWALACGTVFVKSKESLSIISSNPHLTRGFIGHLEDFSGRGRFIKAIAGDGSAFCRSPLSLGMPDPEPLSLDADFLLDHCHRVSPVKVFIKQIDCQVYAAVYRHG